MRRDLKLLLGSYPLNFTHNLSMILFIHNIEAILIKQ